MIFTKLRKRMRRPSREAAAPSHRIAPSDRSASPEAVEYCADDVVIQGVEGGPQLFAMRLTSGIVIGITGEYRKSINRTRTRYNRFLALFHILPAVPQVWESLRCKVETAKRKRLHKLHAEIFVGNAPAVQNANGVWIDEMICRCIMHLVGPLGTVRLRRHQGGVANLCIQSDGSIYII